MKIKIDFLIFYELVQRDYNICALLSEELKRRGYRVVILNMWNMDYWMGKYFEPKVIVTTALRRESFLQHYFYYVTNRAVIVNLQMEQIYIKDGFECDIPEGNCKKAYHVVWGEKQLNKMLQWGIEDTHLLRVGPLRFDFLKEPITKREQFRMKAAKKYSINDEENWILFASDFSYHQYEEKQLENWARNDVPMEYLLDFKRESMLIQDKLCVWFDNFLENHDDVQIIYRPHPTEIKVRESVLDLERKYRNFKIINEGSIANWLVCADCYVTWISTTAIEAFYAGKKVNVIGPIKRDLAVEIFDERQTIDLYEEFEQVLLGKELNKKPILETELNKWYTYVDQEFSYLKLADELERVFRHGEQVRCSVYDEETINREPYIRINSFKVLLGVMFPNCLMFALKKISKHKYVIAKNIKSEFSEMHPKKLRKIRLEMGKRVREIAKQMQL